MAGGRHRWLPAIGAVLLAVPTLGSALDRISADHPTMAGHVPDIIASEAMLARGRMAALADDYARAEALAAKAIASSPADPRMLGLLGQARLQAGDADGAEAAFRASAAFGWREPATQAYWLQAALGAGDWASAALRADALLRARAPLRSDFALLAPFEATAEGRAAFAPLVADAAPWTEAYLMPGNSADADGLLRRAGMLSADGIALTDRCTKTAPLVMKLADLGYQSQARSLAGVSCGEAASGEGLVDSDFRQFGQGEASPFGWRKAPSGDVSIGRADGALRVRNRASAPRLVAWQPVMLEEGEYRAVLKGADSGRWRISLDCDGQPAARAPARGLAFSVNDCPSPALGLWLEPGAGEADLAGIILERE
ncbi:hypothetical protein [Paraurantiacibacter namhicola]|uniref:Tetratricopeptide repeat protein n=1 Tax=Paraurantiacibacter namhicola TaxID=645517 RepID=A0A1C7D626_9SPHN|nr:hypothetical protein [Paraurantiacibacter namhicola]ANU06907.1 hypothetical protein A6F65_00584 [Paraurantiacibacter namhicola]